MRQHIGTLSRNLLAQAVLLFALTGSIGAAQGESFPLSFVAPPQLLPPTAERLEELARVHADAMFQMLLERIEETDKTCGLSNDQKAQLRAAAKGAVQDSLEAWLHPILSTFSTGTETERERVQSALIMQGTAQRRQPLQAGRVQVIQPVPIIVDGRQRAVFLNAEDPKPDPRGIPELILDDRTVLQHRIFQSAINKVLSGSQLARLQVEDSARTALIVRGQQSRLVGEIRTWLALTAQQQEEVGKLLEELTDETVRQWCRGELKLSVVDAARIAIPAFPSEKMRGVLSPVQFDIWTDLSRQFRASAERQQKEAARLDEIRDLPEMLPAAPRFKLQ